jgi:hypothetical protein
MSWLDALTFNFYRFLHRRMEKFDLKYIWHRGGVTLLDACYYSILIVGLFPTYALFLVWSKMRGLQTPSYPTPLVESALELKGHFNRITGNTHTYHG